MRRQITGFFVNPVGSFQGHRVRYEKGPIRVFGRGFLEQLPLR
jgi:hypothetical protein